MKASDEKWICLRYASQLKTKTKALARFLKSGSPSSRGDRRPIDDGRRTSDKEGDGNAPFSRPSTVVRLRSSLMMRIVATIFGIVLAAVGGVIAYRAFFLDPSAAIVISNEGVRELPDTFRVIEGIVLLIVGAAIAFTAALKTPRP
jgi:hypothetical protein